MSEEASIATEAPAASQEVIEANAEIDKGEPGENVELNEDGTPKESVKEEPKPEKTPEQRELDKIRRGLERQTRRRYEEQARREHAEQRAQELEKRYLQSGNNSVDYQSQSGDSDTLSLPKAELERLIEERAATLAPTIASQRAESERLNAAALSLKQSLGEDEFSELTEEIADIFPQERQLALLSANDPAALVRYLADPDNQTEASSIAKMSDFRAGMAIHALELKLKTQAAKETPKESKAPRPFEVPKGGGSVDKDPSNMTDKEFAAWRHRQIAQRR